MKRLADLVAAALFVTAGVAGSPARSGAASPGGEVLLFADGYVQKDVRPDYSRFGTTQAGMFGLLPDYLAALGWSSRWTHRLDAAELARARVVVVINPTRSLDAGERTSLTEWVRGGGALWVLGDHTDILGTHSPLNEMLAPFGVSFNFDTVEMMRPHFAGCVRSLDPSLAAGLEDELDLQFGRGASLTLGGGARPLLLGRATYADAGDRGNAAGAFLGNGSLEPGERAWDVVMAAGASHGAGRVLVFGDTSPLQTPALPLSAGRFVPNCLAWLTERRSNRLPIALVAAVAGLILACRFGTRARWMAIAGAAGLLAGEARGAFVPTPRLDHPRLAIVDASHVQRVDFAGLTARSADGLFLNLMRTGHLPIVLRRWDERRIADASLFVTVSPQQSYSAAERGSLDALMNRGGHVLAFASYERHAAVNELARERGLEIKPVPLGPVPVVKDAETRAMDLQLFNAAPIGYAGPPDGVRGKARVLFQHGGLASVVSVPRGRGAFVLVADDQWPLGDHLESLTAYHEGNIRWFRGLMEALHGS